MNRLPVGRTILDAYGFTFAQLGTIIGLIWFPMVLSTLLNFLPELADGYAGASQPVASQVESLAVTLLTLLLSAIMYVSVARQALGLRQGAAVFHFALGQPEFRVYGALLVLYFLFGIAVLVLAEAMSIGGVVSAVAAVLALPALCLLIYAAIRIGFLLVPAIVTENRIDFAAVWSLSKGNFWRIFAVVLAIAIPLVLIESASIIALMGKDLEAVLPPGQTTDQQVIQQHMLELRDVVHRHMPQLIFISLILAPFSIGLTLSAASSAYRALSGPAKGQRAAAA
ncbi:MAG TPA: hypothetical protein VMU22_14915 [Rhizomicrobium sp.]|nr:hypothetical protein [Rhizomicrobium sp.]